MSWMWWRAAAATTVANRSAAAGEEASRSRAHVVPAASSSAKSASMPAALSPQNSMKSYSDTALPLADAGSGYGVVGDADGGWVGALLPGADEEERGGAGPGRCGRGAAPGGAARERRTGQQGHGQGGGRDQAAATHQPSLGIGPTRRRRPRGARAARAGRRPAPAILHPQPERRLGPVSPYSDTADRPGAAKP